jgi:hypothetical protein
MPPENHPAAVPGQPTATVLTTTYFKTFLQLQIYVLDYPKVGN